MKMPCLYIEAVDPSVGKVGETGQAEEVSKNGKDYDMKHSDVIFYVGTTPDENDSRMRSESRGDSDVPKTAESPEQLCVVTPTAAETSLPWKRPSETPLVSSTRSPSTNVMDMINVSEVPAWIGLKDERKEAKKIQENGQGDAETQLNGEGDSEPEVIGSVVQTPKVVVNSRKDKSGAKYFKNAVVDIIVTSASPVLNSSLNDTSDDTSKHKQVPKEELDPGDCQQNGVKIPPTDRHNHVQITSTPADPYPVRTPADSHSVTALYEDSVAPEEDISPIPPPWRNNDSPVEHDFHQDIPAEPEQSDSNVLFTVGSHAELTESQSVEHEPKETGTGATLPPPWRCSRAPENNKHTIPVSSTVPPTWRQFSNDSSAVRSPSVAATLDSMMPHPSCHSFRISEAESHHSLHMHMHHLIEPLLLPHNNSHCELDSNQDLDSLELPRCDSNERVVHWILNSEADPDLPVNDMDFDEQYERLKQLERERDALEAWAQHSSSASFTDVVEKLPTVHEAVGPADESEHLPMGTTAKTMNDTVKQFHRSNSHKRNSPPPEKRMIKIDTTEGSLIAAATESSYL